MTSLGKRIVSLLVTVFAVSILLFLALRIVPGSPIDVIYGTDQGMSPSTRSLLERKFGLDEPIPIQYAVWVRGFVVGDWGMSYFSDQPVFSIVTHRILASAFLITVASILGILISFPLGCVSALRRHGTIDYAVGMLALLAQATPSFLLALMLIITFSFRIHLFPSFGFVSPQHSLLGAFSHVALPSLTLAIGMSGIFVRFIRASVIEQLERPYVVFARSKGLTETHVFMWHTMRNALMPIANLFGLWVAAAISGSVIVESVFSWPGVGQLLYQSVLNRDYAVVQAVVMLVGTTVVLTNFASDALLMLLNPKLRYGVKRVP